MNSPPKKSQLHASFPPYGIHLHPNVERRSRHFNSEVREADKQCAKTRFKKKKKMPSRVLFRTFLTEKEEEKIPRQRKALSAYVFTRENDAVLLLYSQTEHQLALIIYRLSMVRTL